MAEQLTMFPAAPARRAKAKRPSIEDRFAAFHADNPHVFERMVVLATKRLERGETRISVKALWEELRSSLLLEARAPGDLGYRLDNSFTALYARMLVQLPAFDKVIELRKRKAKR